MSNKSDSADTTASREPGLPTCEAEHTDTKRRRWLFGVKRPERDQDTSWALAFSGGGIRSATFCLGVMQGLVKSQSPASLTDDTAVPGSRESLLPQFDYVSTVSGGGYIGGFFSSLFNVGRLNTRLNDPLQTAEQAYKVFEEEPPGRMRTTTVFEPEHPGAAPLAWLRDNGRYMAPTGSGDMVYALTVTIRNWLSMHYVLGTVMFTALLLLSLVRAELVLGSLYGWVPGYHLYEISLLEPVLAKSTVIWWSPLWWLLLPFCALWLIPSGIAFWLSYPLAGRGIGDPPGWLPKALVFTFGITFIFLFLWGYGDHYLGKDWVNIFTVCGICGLMTFLGCIWYVISKIVSPTIGGQRVTLTRASKLGLIWIGMIAVLALVDTVAQSLYARQWHITASMTSSAAIATFVWIVRRLALMLDEKEHKKSRQSKMLINIIFTIAGVTLFLLVALLWATLALWVQWQGNPPQVLQLGDHVHQLQLVYVLLTASLFSFFLMFCSGLPGFLNLSTLQGLYSARLTRAYLGASNGRRFQKTDDVRLEQKLHSVAEPEKEDYLTTEEYYGNVLAPIHIVNICVNQNSDPDEQLVQRDRKGKPLAILPRGFALDGAFHVMPQDGKNSEIDAELNIGEWIGVSGAAISTGIGRSTTFASALLMGLANMRLGRWWLSGQGKSDKGFLRKIFQTQSYLLDEIFASFYGTHRPLHYLSDGGHFENTAVYELLRKERKVRLIIACDCGCDPQYEFADLANLMRLARIDFGIEIEVDCDIANPASAGALGDVFGKPEDFLPSQDGSLPRDTKCAMLMKVFHSVESRAADKPDAHIIVLKPRLISGASLDLMQYRADRNNFPQEPTGDQFYDEAQWESYRKLGVEIAMRVLNGKGQSNPAAYRTALWKHVLGQH